MRALLPLVQSSVAAAIRDKPYSYVAATSFEDRDTAWAAFLRDLPTKPRKVILFEYDTAVEPRDEDLRCRAANLGAFEQYFGRSCIHRVSKVNPFAFSALVRAMQPIISSITTQQILIDITCMTRVHALAAVSVMQLVDARNYTCLYCYTAPASYGFEIGSHASWKDVLFIPIGKPRLFKREGHAQGLILAGHDGERLSVALQELEPATGTIVYTRRQRRPDLLRKARDANRTVASRLLALRVPDDSPAVRGEQAWRESVLAMEDTRKLERIVTAMVAQARRDRGPVVVYPFGPKLTMVEVALMIAEAPDVDAWVVYPVPASFDVNYSRGVDVLCALRIAGTTMVSNDKAVGLSTRRGGGDLETGGAPNNGI